MVAQQVMMKNIKYCFKISVFKFVCFRVREKWKILTSLEGIWKPGKMLNWSNTCQEVLPAMEEGLISHLSGFAFPLLLIFLVMNIWKCSKWWLHGHSAKCIKNVCITVVTFFPFPPFPSVGRLELYRKVPNLRILACGGDGTVGGRDLAVPRSLAKWLNSSQWWVSHLTLPAEAERQHILHLWNLICVFQFSMWSALWRYGARFSCPKPSLCIKILCSLKELKTTLLVSHSIH